MPKIVPKKMPRRVKTFRNQKNLKLGYHEGSQMTRTAAITTNRGKRPQLTRARTMPNRVAPLRRKKPKTTSSSVRVSLSKFESKKRSDMIKRAAKLIEEKEAENPHSLMCWNNLENDDEVRLAVEQHFREGHEACIVSHWKAFPPDMKISVIASISQISTPLTAPITNTVCQCVIDWLMRDENRSSNAAQAFILKIVKDLSVLVQQDNVECSFLDAIVNACHSLSNEYFDRIKPLVTAIVRSHVFILQRHSNGFSLILKCTRLMGISNAIMFEEVFKKSMTISTFDFGCRAIAAAVNSLKDETSFTVASLEIANTLGVALTVADLVISPSKPEIFRALLEKNFGRCPLIAAIIVRGVNRKMLSSGLSESGMRLVIEAATYYLAHGKVGEWRERAVCVLKWMKMDV